MELLIEFDAQVNIGDGTCMLTVDGRKRTIHTERAKSGDGHLEERSVAQLQQARHSEVLSAKQAA